MFFTIGMEIKITIALASLVLIMMVLICLLRTLFIKNQETKVIQLNNCDKSLGEQYLFKLKGLVDIQTSSFDDPEAFHLFREKLKVDYPNIHENFIKEKIGKNAIFTSKVKIEGAPNILFAAHVDYSTSIQEVKIDNGELFGNGTFDSKSLFFSMFEAVEEILSNQSRLDVNLTIVMTTDDATTKNGINNIVDHFLKTGKFFDLVIEEGSGIVDPSYFGLKSHYALIGIGITGEAIVRFTTSADNKGEKRLQAFLEQMPYNRKFRAKIDKKAMIPLKEIAKDMPFWERFFFNNLTFFKSYGKRKIDEQYLALSKLLKTQIIYEDVVCTEDDCESNIRFEFATYDSVAEVLFALSPSLKKYGIDYQIIKNIESSRVSNTNSEGYKKVEKTIHHVFKSLYTAPVILTDIADKRNYDKVSDCVIRFSPLYYSKEAFRDGKHGYEHVTGNALCYAVSFFKEILKTYTRR
ncbi:MAG: M20/M25/M40 family metallo-hydrolase [Bacilli bacterium]